MDIQAEKNIFLVIDLIVAFLVIICLSLVELGYIPQFKNVGFYCNDPKLNFKYTGDTVSSCLLLIITIFAPYITILAVEWLMYQVRRYPRISNAERPWLLTTNNWYLRYLLGFFFLFLTTDIIKLMIGEPRPHFLDTCQPLEAQTCTTGKYVSDYTCTNTENIVLMKDSTMSFPSGHSSFSVYTGIFLFWYLQKRFVFPSYTLLLVLQFVSLSWAMFVSTSRITDHRHHWWDVLGGSILGASIAIYNLSISNSTNEDIYSTTSTDCSAISIKSDMKHSKTNGFSSSSMNNETLMQNKTRCIC